MNLHSILQVAITLCTARLVLEMVKPIYVNVLVLLKAISRAQPQKNMRYIPQAFVADEPMLARHSTAHFHK